MHNSIRTALAALLAFSAFGALAAQDAPKPPESGSQPSPKVNVEHTASGLRITVDGTVIVVPDAVGAEPTPPAPRDPAASPLTQKRPKISRQAIVIGPDGRRRSLQLDGLYAAQVPGRKAWAELNPGLKLPGTRSPGQKRPGTRSSSSRIRTSIAPSSKAPAEPKVLHFDTPDGRRLRIEVQVTEEEMEAPKASSKRSINPTTRRVILRDGAVVLDTELPAPERGAESSPQVFFDLLEESAKPGTTDAGGRFRVLFDDVTGGGGGGFEADEDDSSPTFTWFSGPDGEAFAALGQLDAALGEANSAIFSFVHPMIPGSEGGFFATDCIDEETVIMVPQWPNRDPKTGKARKPAGQSELASPLTFRWNRVPGGNLRFPAGARREVDRRAQELERLTRRVAELEGRLESLRRRAESLDSSTRKQSSSKSFRFSTSPQKPVAPGKPQAPARLRLTPPASVPAPGGGQQDAGDDEALCRTTRFPFAQRQETVA